MVLFLFLVNSFNDKQQTTLQQQLAGQGADPFIKWNPSLIDNELRIDDDIGFMFFSQQNVGVYVASYTLEIVCSIRSLFSSYNILK